jgi:hypothetical protein
MPFLAQVTDGGIWLWVERLSWSAVIVFGLAATLVGFWQLRQVRLELSKLLMESKVEFGFRPDDKAAYQKYELLTTKHVVVVWRSRQQMSEPVRVEVEVSNRGLRTARQVVLNLNFPEPVRAVDEKKPVQQNYECAWRRDSDGHGLQRLVKFDFIHPGTSVFDEMRLTIPRDKPMIAFTGSVVGEDMGISKAQLTVVPISR